MTDETKPGKPPTLVPQEDGSFLIPEWGVRIRLKGLGDYKHNPDNPVVHDERNINTLLESVKRFGTLRSGFSSEGTILGGNNTQEALSDSDITRVVESETDGHVWLMHERPDLTEEQRRLAAYYDQQTAFLAKFRPLQVLQDRLSGAKLESLLSKREISDLERLALRQLEPGAEEPDTISDAEIQGLVEKWGVSFGTVWEIPSITVPGKRHRLVCGDATDPDTVERLMQGRKAQMAFTDPPYGVSYTGQTNSKQWKMLENDEEVNMYAASLPFFNSYTEPEAALYLCYASSKSLSVYTALRDAMYEQRALLIWNKQAATFGLPGQQYHQKHEPVAYCYKRGRTAYWFGPTNEVTVWDIPRATANRWHPTEKPVDLVTRTLRNSCPLEGIVLDLFMGSGTTMVAAEKMYRLAYGTEITPGYVAVTLERMWGLGCTPMCVDRIGEE